MHLMLQRADSTLTSPRGRERIAPPGGREVVGWFIFRVILQIEKCLTGAEAEEKRGAAESLAPTDPSSVDE